MCLLLKLARCTIEASISLLRHPPLFYPFSCWVVSPRHESLGVELVAADDTAGSARYLREQGEADTAAIASARAAILYDLAILERDIETSPTNSTRFLMIRPAQTLVSKEDALLCSPDD